MAAVSGPVVFLAGGVGAARLLAGAVRVLDPEEIVAVVNVGDDTVLYGLAISPDCDTVTYTLAGLVDPVNGWGIAGDTTHCLDALGRLGAPTWFRLGDQDLATHIYRTSRLAEGARLSEVTAEIARALGVGVGVVPASDDPVRTRLTLASGEDVDFQDYFVRRQHAVAVRGVRYVGAESARPAPGVLDALRSARAIVVAPSNPLLSIGPIRAVAGIEAALRARRDATVAISPLIAGRAVKGPADRLLEELGHVASAAGVARLYAPIARRFVLDTADADLAEEVEAAGLEPVITETLMVDPSAAARLVSTALADLSRGGNGAAMTSER